MPVLYRRGLMESTRVTMISPDYISPNPDQPRRYFDPDGLTELAESIRAHGILQPLSVRRKGGGRYELIAGERRLRAAMICGLEQVPCLVLEVSRESSCLLSLIENLQRRDLDFWEEAKALERLISVYGLSQEEAAAKVGKSQSAVANKLRLLQLTGDQRQFVLDNNLTERHARAVLRLPENRRSEALINIAKRRLNARQTDLYIEQLLNSTAKGRHRISMVRDVRIFVNTIDHAIRLMTDNGVPATAHREEKDGYIEYTVRIPTAAAEK